MTTEKQIQANRLNAHKSTAPCVMVETKQYALPAVRQGRRCKNNVFPHDRRGAADLRYGGFPENVGVSSPLHGHVGFNTGPIFPRTPPVRPVFCKNVLITGT